MNKLDHLFKQKLSDHVQPPPPGAWNAVEANLSKKNNRAPAYRMAAAVAGVALAGSILAWQYSSHTPSHDVALQPVAKEKKQAVAQAKESKHPLPHAPKTSPIARTKTTNVVAVPVQAEIARKTDSTSTMTPAEPVIAAVSLPETPIVVVATAVAVAKPEKARVFEYTLETIEAKPDAAQKKIIAEGKEKKTLRKVLDFALDAKNSDGAVAELRQAKDDFLAFNFKKDKSKSSK